jgi:hypothetical protein
MQAVVRFQCAQCSFVFQFDAKLLPTIGPRAPVHPIHEKSGKVTWRMCEGSGKEGVAV